MEERYHVTTQNRFYPDMSNVNKNITVEAKLISSPTYILKEMNILCMPKVWGQEEASRPKLCRYDDDDDCDFGDDEDDEWPSLSVRLSKLQISAQSPAVLTNFLLPCSHISAIPVSAVHSHFHSHPVQLIIH